MHNRFKVTKQYGRGPETSLDVRFSDFNAAKAHVEEKLIEDAALNVKCTYRIYEYDEMRSEFDSSKIDISALQSQQRAQESQGSQGKGSSASFRPTPLNMSPRPSGTPQKWMTDSEDEDEKK